MLVGDINYDNILNSQSGWAQVLFSFLYWNTETNKSADNLIKKFKNGDKTIDNDYIYDCLNSNYIGNSNVANSILSVDEALKLDLIEIKTNVKDLVNKLNTINDSSSTNKVIFSNDEKVSVIDLASNSLNILKSDAIISNMILEKPGSSASDLNVSNYKIQFKELIAKILSTNEDIKYKDTLNELIGAFLKTYNDVEKTSPDFANNVAPKLKQIFSRGIVKNANGTETIINQSYLDLLNSKKFKEKIKSIQITKTNDSNYNGKYKPFVDQVKEFAISSTSNKLVNLLKQIGVSKLIYDYSGDFKFATIDDGYTKLSKVLTDIEKLQDVKEPWNKLQKSRANLSEANIREYNQMSKIQDNSISAAKMILMLLVTGQGLKNKMVTETFDITSTLYEGTNISFY